MAKIGAIPTLALLVLVLLGSTPLSAQHVVEGRIVNAADAAPIEDVSVAVPSEGILVGTDAEGYFRFEVPQDRPGVALEVRVIGFTTFNRTWMLPLEGPLLIGLEQDAIPLEGIEARVEKPVVEKMDRRVRMATRVVSRVANSADLRAFEYQEAEIWDFFPEMQVAALGACPDCLNMGGRFTAIYFVDDLPVEREHLRSFRVGEICRVEVVRLQVPPDHRNPNMFRTPGGVHAYTCRYMLQVARGERTMPPVLDPWHYVNESPE